MVLSEYKFLNGRGKAVVHYCEVCGAGYLYMNEAEGCEYDHINDARPHSKFNIDVLETGKGNSSLDEENVRIDPVHVPFDNRVIKYYVVVRGVYREKKYEFHIEASNIREVAAKVVEKFPRHSGYSIKQLN